MVAGVIVFLLVTSAFVGIRYWIHRVQRYSRIGDIGRVARVLEASMYFRVLHVIDTALRVPTRLAFDNHDYPEHLIAQVWVDNATEGYVVDAHCARDHCETAPLMLRKGRHTIQLRVIIGDRMSARIGQQSSVEVTAFAVSASSHGGHDDGRARRTNSSISRNVRVRLRAAGLCVPRSGAGGAGCCTRCIIPSQVQRRFNTTTP